MFFLILSTLFLITPPQPDSTLTNTCQEQLIDSTTIEVFQTLHSAYLAVEEFKNQSRKKKYPTFSILNSKHLSVQEFQDTLNCALPPSVITDSTFRIGISIFELGEQCPHTLVISFFNTNSSNNLPLANFRFCIENGYRQYQFINNHQSIKVIIEEEP